MRRKRRMTPRRLRIRLRRELVYRLRVEGATYQEIAEQVRRWARSQGWKLPRGYDRRHVHLDLRRYLAEKERDTDGQARLGIAIHKERYRQLLKPVWPRAMRGSMRSVEVAARLLKRMAELERLAPAAGKPGRANGGGEVEGDEVDEIG